jgi:transcriptional regulator with XRE-family HTH domain
VKPSIEVVIRMADALEVSLDYLVGKSDLLLDKTTIKRIQDIELLPDTDKVHIFYAIDNLIRAAKLKAL